MPAEQNIHEKINMKIA